MGHNLYISKGNSFHHECHVENVRGNEVINFQSNGFTNKSVYLFLTIC